MTDRYKAIREAFDEIAGLCRHLRQGGPAPEDLQDLSDALDEAVGIAANMLHALAQPAAVDGCHCATCTCDPNMTPAVRFDLTTAQTEDAILEHLIRLGWTPPDEVK